MRASVQRWESLFVCLDEQAQRFIGIREPDHVFSEWKRARSLVGLSSKDGLFRESTQGLAYAGLDKDGSNLDYCLFIRLTLDDECQAEQVAKAVSNYQLAVPGLLSVATTPRWNLPHLALSARERLETPYSNELDLVLTLETNLNRKEIKRFTEDNIKAGLERWFTGLREAIDGAAQPEVFTQYPSTPGTDRIALVVTRLTVDAVEFSAFHPELSRLVPVLRAPARASKLELLGAAWLSGADQPNTIRVEGLLDDDYSREAITSIDVFRQHALATCDFSLLAA